jgi:hypothetical protein
MLKKCSKCKQEKDKESFYANKRVKDGLNTFCILCHKADNVARKAKNRADPVFRKAELLYKKEYRERTVEQRTNYMNEWREKNKTHTLEYGKQYRAKNRAHYTFLTQKRKIALLNRTPKWLSEDDLWLIKEIYELANLRSSVTNVRWHVDHIIPLRGKNVSGLHVPQNLRVITWKENQKKTNKFLEVAC